MHTDRYGVQTKVDLYTPQMRVNIFVSGMIKYKTHAYEKKDYH